LCHNIFSLRVYADGVSGPEHGAADSTESTKLPSFIEELGGVGLNQISKPDRHSLRFEQISVTGAFEVTHRTVDSLSFQAKARLGASFELTFRPKNVYLRKEALK
jgi:hypothetical protein